MTHSYDTELLNGVQSEEGAEATDEMPKVVEHFLDTLTDVLVRLARNQSGQQEDYQ